ncbi:SDR family oxidoreductase [Telmatocola sphagniphila]|uniref:SDR family oxidoreductase n=1 Tax=Telmatocola sphagniphila TaxID=1123043 RepID=A0A8E6EXD8_9BACT|nr:SDR family oxidoreductase [Telmatocola sphagniphila]
MSNRFERKFMLVAGGNSGIGLTMARLLASEGASVFITGGRQAELDEAIKEIGTNVIGIQGDVTKPADLDRLFAQIQETSGRLDVVVANAGSGKFVPFGSYTEEHLDATFAVNIKGTVFTVQKALPLLPNGASVVIIGSIAGVKGMPAFGVYAATKAALRSFVRTWSVDLKAKGIRFNIVSPGYIPTPGYDLAGITLESLEPVIPQIPLGRVGTTHEIASAVAFLASSESSYVQASELVVDGGLTEV